MAFIKEKIKILCNHLKEQSKQPYGDLLALEYVLVDEYKKNNEPPVSGWQPVTPSMEFQGRDSHFWVRATFKTPALEAGKCPILEAVTGKEGLWDATNPQGILYLNGEMVQGYDTNHTEAFLEPDTEYQMYNYMYLGMQDDPIRLKMRVCIIDERIEKLYYDILVPYQASLLMSENSDDYIAIMGALEQAANLVDMRDIFSEAYYQSIAEADAYMEKEFYGKLCTTKGKPVINYIGHTHIDMEWQWARAQSREKIQRSFSTASALMKKYPEYKFMLSQPELYQYLKEEAPAKYEELKALVAEGRWEPEGAMWVESDCNLISGESFIRQIMQGKAYFRKEFGKECRMLFLPDVFGYSAAMPQILRKCGLDYFVTSKISWNETNTMPVDEFLWQGIDGTEIFTSFITAQDYRGEKPENFTTYVGTISSAFNKGTWNRFQQKEYGNRAMVTFGFGDGGGGPTKEMLEQFKRLKKGIPGLPVAEMGFMIPHLDELKKQFDAACKKTKRTPKWVGELYLEFHRGTYTSIAKNKKGNRKSELMLQKAEGLSYIDLLNGGSYDAEGIYDTWTKVLHDQFHDILPGSSIKEVYDGTDKDYAEIAEYCNGVIDDKLNGLAENVASDGGVLVYNPLGFERKGTIVRDGQTFEVAEKIPAFGWKVIPAAKENKNTVKFIKNGVKNQYYKLTVDKSGRITSLYDLRAKREVFKKGTYGNEFQVFEDFPREYDAWEITDYYKQKMWILDEEAQIEQITDGSRSGLRITRKYMKSTIVQNVWLYSDSARIDFETEADWHDKHQLLKAAFPFDVHATTATFDIQFGHVVRPTHENTSWDKAKFEVYGHKWVDVSENGYGVSLLNDCKYGYSTEGSTLKITLIKCAAHPNPVADEGMHSFTYSLLPHMGDFRESDVVREAYALNQPLTAVAAPANAKGSLPAEFSLVSCDQPNVMVETVKKAEADDSMIVRMYEAYDRRCVATFTVAEGFNKVYLCDLMEKEQKELVFDGRNVSLPVSNFEIVTLKFVK